MKAKQPHGPSMTLGNIRKLGVGAVAAACVAAAMSGCAFSPDADILSPYAAPGKYDFLDCPSIAQRLKTASAREKQLTDLMSRASEGAGGAIVNVIVYQDDLNTARAELRALRKAADAKQCPPPNPDSAG
jgi:hypothetical protein